jgi:hypothetical protein
LDDKFLVSIFWRHAEEIFATARQNTGDDCRMAILVGAGGAIRITSTDGWNLESLRLHHGAAAAYEVTRRDGQVRVDARSAEGTCVLEGARRRLPGTLPEWPRYQTVERRLELPAS